MHAFCKQLLKLHTTGNDSQNSDIIEEKSAQYSILFAAFGQNWENLNGSLWSYELAAFLSKASQYKSSVVDFSN